jgi:putative oxidoreductase
MEDTGKLILRLTTAGLLLFHGISKVIHGVAFLGGPLSTFHLPTFVAYGVYAGEVIAPLFIIFGAWTRIASLVVIFNMIMAVLLVSYRHVWAIQPTGGWGMETDAFYFLTALVIFLMGAGKYRITPGEGILG